MCDRRARVRLDVTGSAEISTETTAPADTRGGGLGPDSGVDDATDWQIWTVSK
jgi:hypothetical protein